MKKGIKKKITIIMVVLVISLSSCDLFCSSSDSEVPVLTISIENPIGVGEELNAISSEDGWIYIVPEDTAATISDLDFVIVSGDGVSAEVEARVIVNIDTAGLSEGRYMAYAVDLVENISVPSGVIILTDQRIPVLTNVTEGSIQTGGAILSTSDEDGWLYLLPEGTNLTVEGLESAVDGGNGLKKEATAGVEVTFVTTALSEGNYFVCAIDDANNISIPSAIILISSTAPSVRFYNDWSGTEVDSILLTVSGNPQQSNILLVNISDAGYSQYFNLEDYATVLEYPEYISVEVHVTVGSTFSRLDIGPILYGKNYTYELFNNVLNED